MLLRCQCFKKSLSLSSTNHDFTKPSCQNRSLPSLGSLHEVPYALDMIIFLCAKTSASEKSEKKLPFAISSIFCSSCLSIGIDYQKYCNRYTHYDKFSLCTSKQTSNIECWGESQDLVALKAYYEQLS